MVLRVLVIGGGTSGLSAAHELIKTYEDSPETVEVTVLEARERLGGRVHSTQLSAIRDEGLPAVGVDLGANYIHGAACEGVDQPVWELAKANRTLTALVRCQQCVACS